VRYRSLRMGQLSLRASVWKRQPRGWQIVFHQGTPVSPT